MIDFRRQAVCTRFRLQAACLLFFVSFLACPSLLALEVPKRAEGYVTDRAGLLSPSAKADLETVLRAFEEKTSNQVVVVTFPSLEGDSLEDFSMRLAESWKVGQKGRNNGVIFLIFKNDRKIRIEVGYGLEGVLTDALSGQIIREVVAPYFKKGDYVDGILVGTDAIMKATQGEFKGKGSSGDERDNGKAFLTLFFVLFFFFSFLNVLARFDHPIGRRGSRYGGFWMGGGLGGGGGFGGGGGGGFSGGGGGFGGGGASGGW